MNKISIENIEIQGMLFKEFVSNSKNFKVIKEKKNSTVFRIKSYNNNKKNKWSYLVNFHCGTIRRVVAYKRFDNKSGEYYISKVSYNCNRREKFLGSNFKHQQNYILEPFVKIYNHLDMFKKLVLVEDSYKPKCNISDLRHEENYIYRS